MKIVGRGTILHLHQKLSLFLLRGGACGPWESLNLLSLMYGNYFKPLQNQTNTDNENGILAQKAHSLGPRAVW